MTQNAIGFPNEDIAPKNNPAFTGLIDAVTSPGAAMKIRFPILYWSLISNPYDSSTTILANDIQGSNLLFSPSTSGRTYTLPSFADMDAALASLFGGSPAVNSTYDITMTNTSSTDSCTVAQGSNFNIINGNITMASKTRASFRVYKDSVSSYVLI